MDSATLVVATLILILQIITLVVIMSDRKKRAAAPQFPVRGDERQKDRRDMDRDKFRRPTQSQQAGSQWEQKPRRPSETPAPMQVATPVDKSLRDINLRLKSAERDQERARRETRAPGMGGDSSQRSRGERPDRGDRGGDRNRRPDRRNDRRDNRPRPPYQREPGPTMQGPSAAAPQAEAEIERREVAEVQPVAPNSAEQPFEVAREQQVPTTQPTTSPQSEESEESVVHGRKVTVKRRMLRNGEEEAAESAESRPEADSASSQAEVPVEQPSSAEESSEQKQETVYGRR